MQQVEQEKGDRGRSSEKRDRTSSSKSALLAHKDKYRSSSKSVLLTDKERAQKTSHGEKKEHTSRGEHRSKDSKDRRNDTRDRRNRSPAPSHRRESKEKRRSPAKSPPRRKVVLSSSSEDESPEAIRVVTSQDKPKTSGSETIELRIVMQKNQLPAGSELRIIVPQSQPAAESEPKLVYHDYQKPERISVFDRIERVGYKLSHQHKAIDALKDLHERRGSKIAVLLTGSSKKKAAKLDHGRLLKNPPVLSDNIPLPTSMEELLELVKPHLYRKKQGAESSVRVDPDSLTTSELPRAQPDVIQITHGCDLPWDPLRIY